MCGSEHKKSIRLKRSALSVGLRKMAISVKAVSITLIVLGSVFVTVGVVTDRVTYGRIERSLYCYVIVESDGTRLELMGYDGTERDFAIIFYREGNFGSFCGVGDRIVEVMAVI